MYNFNHLYYFYMTVKSKGVTAAAEHLRISQPSLSSQLKVLEDFLEIKLFHKVGRTNQLTPEGTFVYGYCRQMFELSENMHELLANQAPYASRRFYVGVTNEVSRSYVAEVISLFLSKHGDTIRPKVILISGHHDRLVEQLRFREIDVLISHSSVINSDLETLEKVESPVKLVYSVKWKLVKEKSNEDLLYSIQKLIEKSEAQWIVPMATHKLRLETDHFFESEKIEGRVVVEADVMDSVICSVRSGLGIALLPEIYISNEVRNKLLTQFGPKEGYWRHKLCLVTHVHSKNDSLITSLSSAFKKSAT